MVFTPTTHIISENEIAEIGRMGFAFEGSFVSPAFFINAHFAHFDLLALLQVVDQRLAPTVEGAIAKKIFLVDGDQPKLEIQYNSANCNDESRGMALMRALFREEKGLMAKHQYFRLPRAHRNQGISKVILTALLQQYVNMGVKKIVLYASLEDGGLVWAKLHFLATDKEEVTEILTAARTLLAPRQLDFATRIYRAPGMEPWI